MKMLIISQISTKIKENQRMEYANWPVPKVAASIVSSFNVRGGIVADLSSLVIR